jgi:hypothetical protein
MTADAAVCSGEDGGRSDCAVGRREAFFGALEANLKDLRRDYCFPSFRLPWLARMVPWQLQVRTAEREEDLTREWARALRRRRLVADEGDACRRNGFRTYELKRGGIRFRVAAVFVAAKEAGGMVGGGHLACAAQVLREYEEGSARFRPSCASILLVGTDGEFAPDATPMMTGNGLRLLACRPADGDHWRLAWPEIPSDVVWHGFLAHLSPLGTLERQRLLADESRRLQGLDCLASASRLAENLGLPLALVEWEMGQMVKSHAFRLVNGELLKTPGGVWRRWLLQARDALLFGMYAKAGSMLLVLIVGALCMRLGRPGGLTAVVVALLCPFCVSQVLRRFMRT